LTPFERAAWRRTITALQDRGQLQPSDVPAIERYVRAIALARRCWDELGDDVTATGSMGQTVAHPLLDSALKAEKAAEAFAKSLGLEPAAALGRNQGGRPKGTTKPRSAPPPTVTRLRAVK